MIYYAPLSMGEVVDKLTVLSIKADKIDDPRKLQSINKEYALLNDLASEFLASHPECWSTLRDINVKLWDAVDAQKAANEEMDETGVEAFTLASKNAYLLNKERFYAKKKINELSSSDIIEHKDYD